RYRPHIKQSWKLAYPVMLSQLSHVMVGVTDSIMVGHVGATSLAASSLANVIFNLLMLFGIGVSYAITPLVATADGENDPTKVSDVLRHGLFIAFINGLVLIVVVLLCRPLLYYIDQPEEVVQLAIPYLSILAFSLLPLLIFQSCRQFAEGLSNTRIAMIIMLGSVVLNVLLNYILIYGHIGFPALGLNGAGWGSLTSRIMMMFAILGYIYFGKQFSIYRAGLAIGNYSTKLFKRILNIGIPAGMQFIFEVAAFDFSAIMMGWLGTNALAAHQIAINLATISYMTTSGLASAATIRVSNELGKRDFKKLKDVAYTLILLALAFMTLWAIIFIVGRNVLPTIYIDNVDVISIAAPLIVIAGFFQLSDGVQVVFIGALRGLQDVKMPTVFIFFAYWIIGLPLGYYLGFKAGFGSVGIWYGLLTGLTVTAIAMFIRFRRLLGKLAITTAV
ncbi:MAG TPA: MATE family efflux transporter, partial [Cytophagales bacterium]|nr:MATE family efflux transporter [Cytophagales bacterium]